MSTFSLSRPLRRPVAVRSATWRTAALVLRKDLDIERRTRVVANHVAPYGLLVLLVFAFALDADSELLGQAAPGLFWTTVTLSSLTTGIRSFDLERESGALEAIRLSTADLRGLLLGKIAAAAMQLAAIEVVLLAGLVVFYDVQFERWGLLIASTVPATVGIAIVSTFYAAVTSGLRARATAHPLLFLPTITPVLLGATRVWESALDPSLVAAWSWVALLAGFALVSLSVALLLIEPLLEEA